MGVFSARIVSSGLVSYTGRITPDAERRLPVTTMGGPPDQGFAAGEPVAVLQPAQGGYYDARRGVHYPKPLLRGWMHLVWFMASLVVGTLLVVFARGAVRITAGAIYATSVSALFGA